jgi:hypothetical protein
MSIEILTGFDPKSAVDMETMLAWWIQEVGDELGGSGGVINRTLSVLLAHQRHCWLGKRARPKVGPTTKVCVGPSTSMQAIKHEQH